MDYNFVDDLPEENTCQICMKLLDEPQLTDCCGQHYCSECLAQWFQEQGKKQCPHCRSETFTHILYLPLKRKINELKVYCSYLERGCTQTMKLEELEKHLSTDNPNGCGYVNVECQNKCGTSILHKDLTDHYDNKCLERTVTCKFCNEAGPFSHITNVKHGGHIERCREYPVDCPRKCGTVKELKHKDLKKHKEVCPLEPMECPFREAGCKQQLVRKDLDGHMQANTQQHLLNLIVAHKSLATAHESLTTAHESLTTGYKSLQMTHEELKKSDQNLRSTLAYVASEVENIRKTTKDKGRLATSLRIISTKLNQAVLQLKHTGDKLVFELPCDSREWMSPKFTIGDTIRLYLKLESCITLNTGEVCFGTATLFLEPVAGKHDCQFDINVYYRSKM